MSVTDIKQPVNFLIWTLGVFMLAAIARVGWEFGGKLWAMF